MSTVSGIKEYMQENASTISSDENYKKDQRARLAKLIVGVNDFDGNQIEKIYVRGDEYIIYGIANVSEAESFRVLIDTEVEADPNGLVGRFEEIKEDVVNFRSILFKGVHDKSVKHQAANAVSTALRGDVEKARKIFQGISDRVAKEYKSIQYGRIFYLSGSFALVFLFSMLAILFYIFRECNFVKNIAEMKYISYVIVFSGLGGVLSVCINIKNMEFERDSVWYLFFIYGVQRILIASLCGILSYILIRGDLIFTFIMNSANPYFGMMAVCAAAGFSETLIPNALKKIE